MPLLIALLACCRLVGNFAHLVVPAQRAGLPFGQFDAPAAALGNPFTMTGRPAYWRSLPALLDSIRAVHGRVILTPKRFAMRNRSKQYDATMFRAQIDSMANVIDWRAAVADGTITALMILDEPNCGACWGGKPISPAEVAAAADYVKARLGNVPVAVRVVASWWGASAPKSVDVAWAQWEGPAHLPSAGLTPEQFRDRQVADARAIGLKLILGMNVLDGGDGTSGIAGTYADAESKRVNRWQMSGAEIARVGSVFAAAPVCALISWRSSADYPPSNYMTPTQLSGIRAFDTRSDVVRAWSKVAAVARNRSAESCARP